MKTLDLIRAISGKTGLPQVDVRRVFDAFSDLVIETVKNGDDVPLPGLGKFVLKERAPRKARNPKTGETVEVPARKVLAFKVSTKVKNL